MKPEKKTLLIRGSGLLKAVAYLIIVTLLTILVLDIFKVGTMNSDNMVLLISSLVATSTVLDSKKKAEK
jgi:hypothetical protein